MQNIKLSFVIYHNIHINLGNTKYYSKLCKRLHYKNNCKKQVLQSLSYIDVNFSYISYITYMEENKTQKKVVIKCFFKLPKSIKGVQANTILNKQKKTLFDSQVLIFHMYNICKFCKNILHVNEYPVQEFEIH